MDMVAERMENELQPSSSSPYPSKGWKHLKQLEA